MPVNRFLPGSVKEPYFAPLNIVLLFVAAFAGIRGNNLAHVEVICGCNVSCNDLALLCSGERAAVCFELCSGERALGDEVAEVESDRGGSFCIEPCGGSFGEGLGLYVFGLRGLHVLRGLCGLVGDTGEPGLELHSSRINSSLTGCHASCMEGPGSWLLFRPMSCDNALNWVCLTVSLLMV